MEPNSRSDGPVKLHKCLIPLKACQEKDKKHANKNKSKIKIQIRCFCSWSGPGPETPGGDGRAEEAGGAELEEDAEKATLCAARFLAEDAAVQSIPPPPPPPLTAAGGGARAQLTSPGLAVPLRSRVNSGFTAARRGFTFTATNCVRLSLRLKQLLFSDGT